MKIKQRLKRWYSERPKRSIWFYLFLIVLIHHYFVQPIVWFTMLRMGIIAPEVDITPTAERISEEITAKMLDINFHLFEVGQGMSGTFAGKLIDGIAGMLFPYGIYLIIIYIFQGVIRHMVVNVYKSIKNKRSRTIQSANPPNYPFKCCCGNIIHNEEEHNFTKCTRK